MLAVTSSMLKGGRVAFLPDGSPNLMGIYNLMTHKGADKEESENGKVEGVTIVPPMTGGLVPIFGKKR